ncbi:MAG: hypothetical protein M1814_003063 [Vezdaea aestivalis]|nr:MAG: hypothetical protein M1814_003063 [Vezdaea aestivalis]
MVDVLSVAAGIAGLSSLIIQSTQLLYSVVKTTKGASKSANELLGTLETLTRVFASLEEFINAQDLKSHTFFDKTSVIISAIDGLKLNITTLKAKLERVQQKEGLALMLEKGKWFYEQEEHKELIATLSRYVGLFQMSMNVDGLNLLSNSLENVAKDIKGLKGVVAALASNPEDAALRVKQLDDVLQSPPPLTQVAPTIHESSTSINKLRKHMEQEEDKQVLAWLSPLTFWARHQDILAKRQTGTCEWLLNHSTFNSWVQGDVNILWCPGIPGAGKTVFAAVVVEYLEREYCRTDVAVIYAYFNYKESADQTASRVLASLLRQLIHGLNEIPEGVRPKVQELAPHLVTALRAFTRTFVIIDALDECNESDDCRNDILKQLTSLPSNVALLITSRHIPSIENELAQYDSLEIRADDKDIAIFVKSQIEKSPILKRYVFTDLNFTELVVSVIAEKSQGMFLLAHLHIKALARNTNRKGIRNCLQKLPKDVHQTYKDALNRIHSQDTERSELAMKVLTWICYAFRPLTIKEIQHAVSIEVNESKFDEEALPDEGLLISVCAGLVNIDEQSGVIRLIHYTAQEYFDEHREQILPCGHISITELCLTYLSFIFQPRDLSSKVPWEVNWNEIRNSLFAHPFIAYSAICWGEHAAGEPEDHFRSQILDYLAQSNSVSSFLILNPHFLSGLPVSHVTPLPETSTDLWLAAHFGLTKIAALLIDQNGIGNMHGIGHRTTLYEAALCGHQSLVELLLDNSANVYPENWRQSSLLRGAIQGKHQSIINLLLERRSLVNIMEFYFLRPFAIAIRHGSVDTFGLLLKEGLDPRREPGGLNAMLGDAIERADETILHTFLESAVHFSTLGIRNREAPISALEAHTETIEIDVPEDTFDIDHRDESGHTALQKAIHRHDLSMTKVLLEHGSNKEVVSGKEKRTPLLKAAFESRYEFAELLLEGGRGSRSANALFQSADPNAKDADENTPLHFAARFGDVRMTGLLLRNGARIQEQNRLGETPLHNSVTYVAKPVLVMLLLRAGADPNCKNNKGDTPLHRAARGKPSIFEPSMGIDREIVDLLVERRADTAAKNDVGQTPEEILAKRALQDTFKIVVDGVEPESLNDKSSSFHEDGITDTVLKIKDISLVESSTH